MFKEAQLELPEPEREAFHSCTEFLEDIIQDDSPSINLHFESGRLVILDLTDPFTSRTFSCPVPLQLASLTSPSGLRRESVRRRDARILRLEPNTGQGCA